MFAPRLGRCAALLTSLALLMAGCGAEQLIDTTTQHVYSTARAVADWKDGAPRELRMRMCEREGGIWTEMFSVSPCENEMASWQADLRAGAQRCGGGRGADAMYQCVHLDAEGRMYFNDGPSVPAGMQTISGWVAESLDQLRYAELMWDAGVAHDYCYHHNPVTRGADKAQCDREFIADLVAICRRQRDGRPEWFKLDVCKMYATLMYGAVVRGGEDSWAAFNLEADYPAYVPMWQQLQMDEDPYTEAMQQEISDTLVKYKILDGSHRAD